MKILKLFSLTISIILLSLTANAKYQFSILTQVDTSNTFWQGIKRGMDDACETLNVDCQLVFNQENGNLQMQLTNLEALIEQGIDGISLVIVEDNMFDEAVQKAVNAGIPVITTNVDDSDGSAGNARLAFVGQDLFQAGYELGRELSKQFPDEDVHVLLGLSAPGQSWAEARIGGVEKFLNEYKTANPGKNVTWDTIDSGLDTSVTGQRICAYVQGHPETTAYFDAGFWGAGAGNCLRDLGYKPNELLMGMFDLVDIVMDEMDKGYVHLTIDQQPYLQGYLPILQMYLMKEFGLSAWDVNTGKAFVYPSDVSEVRKYIEMGVR
jgi:simple sugar transport system substrate-binding protein